MGDVLLMTTANLCEKKEKLKEKKKARKEEQSMPAHSTMQQAGDGEGHTCSQIIVCGTAAASATLAFVVVGLD